MQKPNKPANDKSRVFTLRSLDLLDTNKEERFDRLTRLAMRIFEVPIALVSLVDENRQWFKSCQGLSISETSRDVSFCGHAILGDDAFVIQDTHQDPRFDDNPFVINEPYIRFYAGYPITYVEGTKLGTLCLIDHKPRHFSQREKLILKELAELVEHEIHATQIATMDELTEIYNRRGFLSAANQALNLCRRESVPVSLVFLDLNKFKQVNDNFGHEEGDNVLKQFAENLKQVSRQTDILGRIGGDEFVLLLPNALDAEVEKILLRFADLIEEVNQALTLDYRIAYSYGSVTFDPEKHQGLEDLLVAGDQLMYQRKRKTQSS
ncbi:diguanylate cyclase domain-containing protein [Methylophaga sp.]|uniref:GGDEF domain-containing protein n=1 Tax=Methylophaga sp. TaxID=2024840 RepID=UPI003F6A1681